MTGTPLKLKAKDAEDLQVVSAVLQDAIAPVCDMTYRSAEKDFVMVVQRFCRERGAGSDHCHERVRCAVHVKGVEGAEVQGIDQSRPDAMLDLLAIMPEEAAVAVAPAKAGAEPSPGKMVAQLVFAGGGRIRLQLGDWSMILEDFGEPWPASCEPHHAA